jgi:hypothetical protein
METRSLSNGLEVEFELRPTTGGYMILHHLRGKETVTVTCCCEGGGCVSTTCSYAEGEPPSPTCDCTGSSPSVSC